MRRKSLLREYLWPAAEWKMSLEFDHQDGDETIEEPPEHPVIMV